MDKVYGMSWVEDGFYYSTFPKPIEGKEYSQSNEEVRSIITNLVQSKVKTG